jgi:hypothetical protein
MLFLEGNMGLFDIFKKEQNKDFKEICEPEKSNEFRLTVELTYTYTHLFDSDKIYNSLNKYFDNYFRENPVNGYNHNLMGMAFGGEAFMTDSCKVRVTFEEEKIDFLSESQINEWKRQLSIITYIPEQSISIYYMTSVELDDKLDRLNKTIQSLEKLDNTEAKVKLAWEQIASETEKRNARLNEVLKEFEKYKDRK